jgi:hypothetical protein
VTDNLPKTRLRLAEEAADIISPETTSVDLCAELDVSKYAHEDPKQDSGNAKPFEPMFRARLLQELEDYSDSKLWRELGDPDVGRPLGFDPNDLPRRSTFQRARTERFETLESRIETLSQQIKEVAAEVGSPIGPELTPEDTRGTSKRTEDRLIRSEMQELTEEVARIVFPAWNLPRPDEAIYDEEDFLEMEAVMGINQKAANQGGEIYGDWLDHEADLGEDDPFYEDGPTGETHLTVIKELAPETIAEMVNRALARIFPRIRPYEEFPEPVMLAIDITYVGITVDGRELQRVTGAPNDKDFEWCYKFATANIVGDNLKLPVAVLPVSDAEHLDNDAYPGKDKKYRPGNVVRNLLDIADDHVNVRCVLADREFYATDVIVALLARNDKYVIPVPANARIKRFQQGIEEVTVKRGHTLYGPTKRGVTNDSTVTRLVALPPDDSYDDVQVFATNLDVDDKIGLDRRRTKRQIERYNRRGGIENAYKKIKEFGAWTTKMDVGVRLFHFGWAVILYALWLLVDFLVKLSLDLEYEVEPRLRAGRFRDLFGQRFRELI